MEHNFYYSTNWKKIQEKNARKNYELREFYVMDTINRILKPRGQTETKKGAVTFDETEKAREGKKKVPFSKRSENETVIG